MVAARAPAMDATRARAKERMAAKIELRVRQVAGNETPNRGPWMAVTSRHSSHGCIALIIFHGQPSCYGLFILRLPPELLDNIPPAGWIRNVSRNDRLDNPRQIGILFLSVVFFSG